MPKENIMETLKWLCKHTEHGVGKCIRKASIHVSHTPVEGKSLRNAPKFWSNTPAMGKCLGGSHCPDGL